MKRIILFIIIIFCIISCYDTIYVGISDRYMGVFRSRQQIFGSGYNKYLFLNIKSGGLIIYFGGEKDNNINGLPEYTNERIDFRNFTGNENVYNFYNNDYVGKLVFYSDDQVAVTLKGQGIFNLENIICDRTNN